MSHSMVTRSKSVQSTINGNDPMEICHKVSASDIRNYLGKPLSLMEESAYNSYNSQQICTVRDISLESDYQNMLNNSDTNKQIYLQELFDAGCALMNYDIVIKNGGKFELNKNFDDYTSWLYNENNIIDNCRFFRKLGHPLYN